MQFFLIRSIRNRERGRKNRVLRRFSREFFLVCSTQTVQENYSLGMTAYSLHILCFAAFTNFDGDFTVRTNYLDYLGKIASDLSMAKTFPFSLLFVFFLQCIIAVCAAYRFAVS